jgi:hypothetical protein
MFHQHCERKGRCGAFTCGFALFAYTVDSQNRGG